MTETALTPRSFRIGKSVCRRHEGTLVRESAHVELVEDHLFQGNAAPSLIVPTKIFMIHHLRGAVHPAAESARPGRASRPCRRASEVALPDTPPHRRSSSLKGALIGTTAPLGCRSPISTDSQSGAQTQSAHCRRRNAESPPSSLMPLEDHN